MRLELRPNRDQRSHVPLDDQELLMLHQILNYAANGLHCDDMHKAVGVSRENLQQYLDLAGAALENGEHRSSHSSERRSFDLEVSTEEGSSVTRTIQLVLDEAEEWEFPILIGFPFAEGQALLAKFNTILNPRWIQSHAAV